MTYEAYTWMCYISAGLSGLMAIISVALFFKLKIVKVVGDLTGSNAKKAIRDIKEKSNAAGKAIYNTGRINQNRGRITDRISNSGNLQQTGIGSDLGIGTEKLSFRDENATTVLYENSTSNKTTVLSQNSQLNETTVLYDNLQSAEKISPETVSNKNQNTFKSNNDIQQFLIEQDITFTHSNERIA